MKIEKIINFVLISMVRESKRTTINIIISTFVFTMLLVISSLYATMQNSTGNQLVSGSDNVNLQEVNLGVYKSEFLTIDNVMRRIDEVISDGNMINSVDVIEENEELIEIVVTLNDYKNNILVTSKLDKVNGFTVTIEDEKLSNLEILRIIENITRYMMYGIMGIIFITMLFNQSHLMNEKRSEYAQLKAFGYQSFHISIIIAVNALAINLMSYILAIIMTHLVLKIDFSIIENVNYTVKLEMLGPINIILDFLLIVIITICALLMILSKIEQIEPMMLLKKYQN